MVLSDVITREVFCLLAFSPMLSIDISLIDETAHIYSSESRFDAVAWEDDALGVLDNDDTCGILGGRSPDLTSLIGLKIEFIGFSPSTNAASVFMD